MAALVFPTAVQAAAQTPLNTFSPTSTPLVNTSNGFTYVYDTTLGVWTSSSSGGGGGGTVTGVTATLPLVSSGGATPDISINLGLGTGLNGSNIAVSIPAVSPAPAINTTATGAFNGSLYWDDTLTQLFIRYNNGGSPVWVAAAPSASGGGSTVTAATLAEAAAGTLNTVFSSPETAVPKNASGMTGAAIIPGGTTVQQPGGATAGWFRYNADNTAMEFYDGANWISLASVSATTTFGLGLNVTGQLVKAAVPEAAAPPAVGALPTQAVIGSTYYDTTLGAMFIYYSNGGAPTWVMV